MRHIWDITKSEVGALFKIADFEDYEITRLERETDCGIVDCLIVYAESEWDDGDEIQVVEDEIVRLFPTMYEDSCNFTPGFKLQIHKYIQWALWCDLIEKVDFNTK